MVVLVVCLYALLELEEEAVSTCGCLAEGGGCGVLLLLLVKASGEDIDDCRREMIAVGGLGERLWEEAGA